MDTRLRRLVRCRQVLFGRTEIYALLDGTDKGQVGPQCGPASRGIGLNYSLNPLFSPGVL